MLESSRFQWAMLTSNGIPESGAKSMGLGAIPARTAADPRAAICAPLSVQKRSGGRRKAIPASSQRSAARDRRRELAE